jgi:hypothetical protein
MAFGLFAPTRAHAVTITTCLDTFVSTSSGADTTTCGPFSAPCRSIAQAVLHTSAFGRLTCLDSDNYDQVVTITTTIVIDCSVTKSRIGAFVVNGAGIFVTIRGGIIFNNGGNGILFQNGAGLFVVSMR